uniref:Cation/H+ exchanger transmembrane domain-containing protein n=1 Tax=Arcella intermedia TaxID=1963864 RepID=A0A6B2LB78_9EUKA|eukprot:TRINITY_DN22225_c0_g1_i1.p1 TRINITY_DN22225_c0_g1~~TRINITY_DN22225_c0_g1_i1.p1  ORF type:complete len:304 (-),score=55.94 TRINITY_DN22225_c0_g1_i1:102-1013(-)
MKQLNALGTKYSNIITTAAVIDDVWCLLLMSFIVSLMKQPSSPSETTNSTLEGWNLVIGGNNSGEVVPVEIWPLVQPIVCSVLTGVIGCALAKYMEVFLGFLRKSSFLSSRWRSTILVWMAIYGFGWSMIAAFSGASYLLGAFVAGLAFSNEPEAHSAWNEEVSPIQNWLVLIFFGSIGFLIPISQLFEGWSVLWGLVYTIISFFTKMVVGIFMSPIHDGYVIGFAMVARGELGLVLLSQAYQTRMMSSVQFVASIWAILLCTFISPFLFGKSLAYKQKQNTKATTKTTNNPIQDNQNEENEG